MDDLNLYVVTFNCGRALIEQDIFGQHIFDKWQNPDSESFAYPDVVVFNLQEVAPLGYAFIGGNFVKPYFDHFRQALQVGTKKLAGQHNVEPINYRSIVAKNCGLTGLIVFVRENLIGDVRQVSLGSVGVGVSEMGNKGAVGARISWRIPGSETLLHTTFVSAHLAPFEAEVERRDQDYRDIVKGLVFSKEDAQQWKSQGDSAEGVPLLTEDDSESEDSASSPCGIYMNDTFLIFSGDLNYRTALTTPGRDDFKHYPQPSADVKSDSHYIHLLDKDQLRQQMEQGKTLQGLTEQNIDFPPTYKYHSSEDKPVLLDEDIQEWNWAKHRWPSWCDRILFSSMPLLNVKAGTYSALPIFRTSDHRPVALSVSIPRQPISDSQLAQKAPAPLDSQHGHRRAAARRKEIVVGIATYLSLTWEGNSLLAGAICIVLGTIYILKSLA